MTDMTDNEFFDHLNKVAADYHGDSSYLTAAIGAAVVGRLYGWRVIRITTSSKVYTRHQKILGLDFKKVMLEETDLSSKSYGYSIAKKLDKFWDVVNGTFTIGAKEKTVFN